MSRYIVETFTSPSVAGSGNLVVNHVILSNQVNINKIKVVPSVLSGTNKVEIFKHATCLPADTAYATDGYLETLVDPVQDEDDIVTEKNEGFVATYEDLDATNVMHIKLTNGYVSAKTYTITLTYELVSPYLIITKSTTGDPASASEFTMYVNTFDNKVKIWADGAWRQLASW